MAPAANRPRLEMQKQDIPMADAEMTVTDVDCEMLEVPPFLKPKNRF